LWVIKRLLYRRACFFVARNDLAEFLKSLWREGYEGQ
jgi:hypothetical protein